MTDWAALFGEDGDPEPPETVPPPPGARCADCAEYQRGTRSEWGACPPVGLRKDHHRACSWFAARPPA